jgi:nicotinamidase/pyrazinamidase
MTRALLVIDVQNDFCPGGALAVPGGDEVVAVINGLMPHYDAVIFTQDWHPPGHASFASSHPGKAPFEMVELSYGPQVLWPDHCVQGTRGAEFHPDLDTRPAQAIIRKGFRPKVDSYSAFFENDHATPTGLEGYLRSRGIDEVHLSGLATDFCVGFSALDAVRCGFPATVIEDACRAIDLDGSLADMRRRWAEAGVRTATSDEILHGG